MNEKQRSLFWAKVQKTDTCWLWTGWTEYGYGRFGKPLRRVHRLAYEDLVGPIPDGMVIDHRCHSDDLTCAGGETCPHRRCVNPDHLEPVHNAENVLRGRGITADEARRTTCPRGHVLIQRKRARRCRECNRPYSDRTKARLRDRFLAGEPTRTQHGTVSGYALGCRCEPCRAARREYDRERRQRQIGVSSSG